MVLASGEQVTASETENADLFWAVRGAGQVRRHPTSLDSLSLPKLLFSLLHPITPIRRPTNNHSPPQNFGVVTAFTFRGYPQANPVYAGTLIFLPDKLPQIVEFANKFHDKNDG